MANRIKLMMTLLLVVFAGNAAFAGDEITICAQNVQNFFYTLDRERTQGNYVPISNYNTEAGRQAKANAIVNALAPYKADIYAFNEVEAKAEGAYKEALDLLAAGLSSKTGLTYKVVSDGLTYDLTTDALGTIKSGFIYRADKVEPVGDNLSTAVGYTEAYPYMMRMQTFRSLASGEMFTLSMNHFKASTSNNMEEDALKREQNSIALLKGLDQATLDPDILVLGDLNSVMGEQCLQNLVDAGYEEQILKRHPTAYTYYFDYGELIDHVFANRTMAAQITDARVLNIANPHSTGSKYNAYSDHDPYLVTLNLKAQPATKYIYAKATSVTTGNAYLMVANDEMMANPVPTDKVYGDFMPTNVTVTDGMVVRDDAKNAFRLVDAGDGTYYIKDYYGRFLYNNYNSNNSKYYNSVNVGDKSMAHAYTITPQNDGTYKILNTVSNYYFLYHSSWGKYTCQNWAALYSGQYLPALFEYDPNAITDDIAIIEVQTQPVNTRKVIENGTIYILTPDGHRYTLQGIMME